MHVDPGSPPVGVAHAPPTVGHVCVQNTDAAPVGRQGGHHSGDAPPTVWPHDWP